VNWKEAVFVVILLVGLWLVFAGMKHSD